MHFYGIESSENVMEDLATKNHKRGHLSIV